MFSFFISLGGHERKSDIVNKLIIYLNVAVLEVINCLLPYVRNCKYNMNMSFQRIIFALWINFLFLQYAWKIVSD